MDRCVITFANKDWTLNYARPRASNVCLLIYISDPRTYPSLKWPQLSVLIMGDLYFR
jgi:hypothetical protein